MSNQSPIYLKNIKVVSREGGNISAETIQITIPTPCAQKNAKGNLRSYDNVKQWRSAAWETGARFRKALS